MLEEVDGAGTWVTVVPLKKRWPSPGNRYRDVLDATGEAWAMFVAGIVNEKDAVERRIP